LSKQPERFHAKRRAMGVQHAGAGTTNPLSVMT